MSYEKAAQNLRSHMIDQLNLQIPRKGGKSKYSNRLTLIPKPEYQFNIPIGEGHYITEVAFDGLYDEQGKLHNHDAIDLETLGVLIDHLLEL